MALTALVLTAVLGTAGAAAAAPPPPTIGTATAGNAQASVTFTGTAGVTFTATSSPGGLTASGPGSPLTVTGLTNGTTYTFTVTATDATGTSAPSVASNAVTPAGRPDAPPTPTAVAQDRAAIVSFGTPAANGLPISGYTVTADPGGATATGSRSPVTVTGLTNGTTYTFTVTATNGLGDSTASPPSNAVSPTATVTMDQTGLPDGVVGAMYDQTFTSSGGTAPYGYTLSAGALPSGLSLSSGGRLSGIPTAGGTFVFTIRSTDQSGATDTRSYTLVLAAPTIVVAPATLPGATAETAYSQTLSASGGTAPYSYAVTAGALPPGVALSSSGLLSGTPASAGAYNFTLTATDSSTGAGAPFTGSQGYTLTVAMNVAPPGTAPTVTAQPADTTVAAGQPATFTAAAIGDPTPTVQWQQLIGGTWTDLAGATAPTLTLPDTTTGQDQTQYRAVFTNNLGSATSSPATLTITEPVIVPPPVSPPVTPPATHAAITSPRHARFHPGRHHRFTIRTDAPAGTHLTAAGHLPEGLHLRIHGDHAVLAGTAAHPSLRILRLALHRGSRTGPVIARQRLNVIASNHRLAPLPDVAPTDARPLRHIPRHTDPGQKLLAFADQLARRTPVTIAVYTATGHRVIGYAMSTRDGTLRSVFELPPDLRGPVTIVVATRVPGGRPTYLVAHTETGP